MKTILCPQCSSPKAPKGPCKECGYSEASARSEASYEFQRKPQYNRLGDEVSIMSRQGWRTYLTVQCMYSTGSHRCPLSSGESWHGSDVYCSYHAAWVQQANRSGDRGDWAQWQFFKEWQQESQRLYSLPTRQHWYDLDPQTSFQTISGLAMFSDED